MLSLLPERFRPRAEHRSRVGDADNAAQGIRLTSTQAMVCDGIAAALRDAAACIVLTSAASFGKTTVLSAALVRLSEPSLQIIRLHDAGSGMEDAFQVLFAPTQQRHRWRQPRDRRVVVVVDQAETMRPETVAYLELLTRMPGKEASVQWVIVGRSIAWDSSGGQAARWLREVDPVRLTLTAMSEQDAWELFHHRVSPAYGVRSASRLVGALLQQSGGLPGRFDAALQSAIGAGLLKGVPAQAA